LHLENEKKNKTVTESSKLCINTEEMKLHSYFIK